MRRSHWSPQPSQVEAEESFKPRLALAIFGVILFAQLALVISTPKNISWDPSYGLLAAQQKLAGISPSIFTLVEAEPTDITRVSARPVPYWAPAYQAVPYTLRCGVFDWGVALNLTLGLVLVAGAIGWLVYFAQILETVGLALWLSVIIALTRFRWTMPLTYDGGDQLLWGAAPWVLILAAAALRRPEQRLSTRTAGLSAGAGAAGASLFALKYSGIFLAIGAGAVFCLICLRYRCWQRIFLAGAGFLSAIGAIMWAGFPQIATPIASEHGQMNIFPAVASLGVPAIGVTDLDRFFRATLQNTSLDVDLTVPFIGLVVSLLMFIGIGAFITSRSAPLIRGDQALVQLAIGAVAADLLILFLVILDGGDVSPAGRFGRVSGFLLLPILVAIWLVMFRERRLISRAFASVSAVTLLIFPTAWATARQLPNLVDRLYHSGSVTDADGIVNVHLSPGTDAQAFYAEIQSIAPEALLYAIYPQMAFPLPQRPLILVEAEEQETPATLSRRRYHGRPSGGVALLLPVAFEHNGKVEAIKASFVDIPYFVRHELRTDPNWALWTGVD